MLLCLLAGCAAPRPELTLGSDDQSIKIPAMKQAAKRQDLDAAPKLIEQLNDEDPAVRFYAIEALQRLTGENMGYLYYENEPQRQEAIQRWRQWWEARESQQDAAR